MKFAEIHPLYYAQGVDLQGYISLTGSNEEALEAHARSMDKASSILRKMKEIITGRSVVFTVDEYTIIVSGSDEVIQDLIDAKCAGEIDGETEEDCGEGKNP